MKLSKSIIARSKVPSRREPAGKHPVSVWVPVRTVSEPNARDHWSKRHARAATQHDAVAVSLRRLPLPALPAVVMLTRVGKKVLDSDNCAAALKAVRDAIAAEYGVDDACPLLIFQYGDSVIGLEGAVHIYIRPVSLLSILPGTAVLAESRLAAFARHGKGGADAS